MTQVQRNPLWVLLPWAIAMLSGLIQWYLLFTEHFDLIAAQRVAVCTAAPWLAVVLLCFLKANRTLAWLSVLSVIPAFLIVTFYGMLVYECAVNGSCL